MPRRTRHSLSAGLGASATGAATDETELLDLLEAGEDTAVFLVRRDTAYVAEAAQAPAGTATTHNAAHQPALPTSLLVGGSLFARDLPQLAAAPPFRSREMAAGPGAVFCPFVRSFYPAWSPHWAHLCASGFAYGFSPLHGNRVFVSDPQRLMKLACQLQGRPVVSSPRRHPEAVPSRLLKTTGSAPSDAARHAALFAAWGWSPRLRRTLGATLCNAPLSTFSAFRETIHAACAGTDGKDGARRIPVTAARLALASPVLPAPTRCTLPPAAQPLRPWLMRCRVLQAPTDAAQQRLMRPNHRFLLTRPPLPPLGEVGAAQANASVLGGRPLCESTAMPLSPHPLRYARATLRLFGLPAEVRAAFLELPFHPTTPADAMETACAAALARLSAQLADAVSTGAVAATSQLYVCPLAHAVDFSGTLDLWAFPVDWRGVTAAGRPTGTPDDTAPSCAAAARVMEAVVRDAPPALSLGVETIQNAGWCTSASSSSSSSSGADPPLRVVVFPNAHLLSRRAMRRLIDQWTRNGAVTQSILQREREQETQPGGAPSHRKQQWHTLMGGRLPLPPHASSVLPHVRTLTVPLGDVQAVFIGYAAVPHEQNNRECPRADRPAPPPRSPRTLPSAELVVDAGVPRRDLLFVEEPFSAALLRASAAYRTALSPDARRDLLASLVQCVVDGAGPATVLTQRCQMRLPTGRVISEKRNVLLHHTEGRLLLYEACEAVLAVASPFDCRLHPSLRSASGGGGSTTAASSQDDVVSLLLTYPFLSSLRCRHVLLSSFRVRLTSVTATPVSNSACSLSSAPCSSQRVRFVHSCAQLNENEERERQRLLAAARARSATLGSMRTAAPQPILRQVYTAYPEPPLLLGWWCPTLLFCAPTLADVVPLRTLLREALSERFSAVEAAAAPVDPTTERRVRWEVEDVDIAHVDCMERGGPGRRPLSRRFTVRASLRRRRESGTVGMPAGGDGGEVSADLSAALWRLGEVLQHCLKSVARAAVLFPMWSTRPSSETQCKAARACREAMRERFGAARPADRGAAAAAAAGDSTHPDRRFLCPFTGSGTVMAGGSDASFVDFMSFDEAVAPRVPSLVERRLFNMAATQCPSFSLTLGTRVVLLRSVQALNSDAAAAEPSRCTARCRVPRGQVCEVVGFVSRHVLLRRSTGESGGGDAADGCEPPMRARRHRLPDTTSSSNTLSLDHLPVTVQQQLAELTAEEQRLMGLYLEQQRAATSLPLVQPLHPSAAGPFVVVPRPHLVGGFRSVHYYGVPLLHLPLLVLSGGHSRPTLSRAAKRPMDKTCAPCTVTSLAVSFDFPLTQLLHPHCTDPVGRRAELCLTAQERSTALRLLFPRSPALSASPMFFVEDLFLTNGTVELAAPSVVTVVEASSPAAASPLHCPLLTEIALFSRFGQPRAVERGSSAGCVSEGDGEAGKGG